MTASRDQGNSGQLVHCFADMIVIPFHHRYRHACFGMIPIRDGDGFMLVSPRCYDPEHYLPGSCIQ